VGAALNPEREFLPALYGVLMGGGFLWAVAYLYYALRGRDGMGGGDIKLLAWIGAVLGWKAIPVVILVSSLLGALIGIILALRTKDGLKQAIPFGPYLAGAALLYLLFDGASWADWYLALHGL
jgi:leader peptidase (prepilin peptidase)/N-methyltransferase